MWVICQLKQVLKSTIIKKPPTAICGHSYFGCLLLDAKANGCLVFDPPGMFRAWVTKEGKILVWMYG